VPRHLACDLRTLVLALLLGGCRVEQTPDEYFDHAATIEAERRAAGGEVRDRLLAFVSAAGRGDPAEALISLHPAEDIELVGPAGVRVSGLEGVRALVTGMVTTPVSLRVRDVEVETGPAGGVAWFRLVIEAPGTTPEPALYQATGTYLRDAGLWELVQAHVAGPVTSDSSTSSPPDSAATPEEGG
jgi:hypothetical protein